MTTCSPENRQQRRFLLAVIAVTVVVNLAMVGYATLNLYLSRQNYLANAETRSHNVATAIDQAIAINIEKVDTSLQTLVDYLEDQLPEDGSPPPEALRILMQRQLRLLPEANSIRLWNKSGTLWFEVGLQNKEKILRTSIADNEPYLALKEGGNRRLFIAKPMLSALTKTWIVPMVRAIHDKKGRFAGLVSIPFSIEHFNRLLAQFKLNQTGVASLLDKDFGLVASNPVTNRIVPSQDGRTGGPELEAFVASSEHRLSMISTASADGIERVTTLLKARNSPFLIVVGVGLDEYLSSWRAEARQTALFLTLLALFTIAAAWLVTRYWRRLLNSTMALEERSSQLETALVGITERDQVLASAREGGHLGTFSLDFSSIAGTRSNSFESIFGLAGSEPYIIDAVAVLIHPEDRPEVEKRHRAAIEKQAPFSSGEYRILRKNDGALRWVATYARYEYDTDGSLLRMTGVAQDITGRKALEESLQLNRQAFMSSTEGILITDKNGIILDVNPAFSVISGYAKEELVGNNPGVLKSGRESPEKYQLLWQQLFSDGAWTGELQNRHKDGRIYTQHTRISSVRDAKGLLTRFVCMASDVTELRNNQQRIEYLAYHDKLTDLPNRALLTDRMQQAIAQTKRRKELLGICYLDLDNFKPLNDQRGHAVGDIVLTEVARRLEHCVRSGDTVARMGGDEFVVLLCNIHEELEIQTAVQRMLDAVSQPYKVGEFTTRLTVSFGVTIYPKDDTEDADGLIRHADQAMYAAKRTGKNRLYMFDAESERRLREYHDLFSRVVLALERKEFQLFYQPKVSLEDGSVVAVEALIRWAHPEQGILGPGAFLPVIEENEFSVVIGEWVIRTALAQMSEWHQAGVTLPISVNVSAYHLQRPDFAERLAFLLAEYPRVQPAWLDLEVLETTAMEALEQVTQVLEDCIRQGVTCSLDDFGTGYSSLTYFRRLPVNSLKIDKSFIMDMLTNEDDRALVKGIVSLAHGLQRKVVAEGVETLEHGIPLLKFKCDVAQGFGIARPMPANEVLAWVQQWSMPALWRSQTSAE